MSWKKEVDGIVRRRALELGGKEAVEPLHARGRLTVRERIEGLESTPAKPSSAA